MGNIFKRNNLNCRRISNKIICLYVIFVLIISIVPIVSLSEKPRIDLSIDGGGSNSYVNISVDINCSENVSSFIDFDNSLVGYWNFEDSTNWVDNRIIPDNSTYENNASCVNGRSNRNITSGRYGDALYFNGSGNGYVEVNDNSSLDLTDELTLELWFKEFETTFSKSFSNRSGHFEDYGYSVDQTSDGGYIFVGEGSYYGSDTGDIFISKHDSNGNLQDKTFYSTSEEDIAYEVIETNDKKYAITGFVGTGNNDLWFGEYFFNTTSNKLENTTVHYINGGETNDKGFSLKQANDGDYIIAGSTFSYGNPDLDIWLLKLNSSDFSDEKINNTFGANGLSEKAYSVCIANDDNYTIVGYRSLTNEDIIKIKANNTNDTDWNSKVIWSKNNTGWGDDDSGRSIIKTKPDNGFLVVGYSNLSAATKQDIFIQKIGEDGNNDWNITYDSKKTGKNFNIGYSGDQTRDNGYIIAGQSGDSSSFYLLDSSRNLTLIKLNYYGIKEWNRTFNIIGQQEGRCIKQTSDGGYIVAGFTNNSDEDWMNFWLLKTNITGHLTTSNNNQSLNKTLIGKGRDAYQLELCNGTVTAYLNGTAVVSNTTDLYNLTQNWNHLVLTYDKNANGNNTNLYLNKELVDSINSPSKNISTNLKNLTIGRNFSGIIDEVRIWNRALSNDEINASYDVNLSNLYYKNFTDLSTESYDYNIYAINSTGGENYSSGTITILGSDLPTVFTNSSTGIEETNATLRGYLVNNGSADTTCGFRFGTTSGSYNQNFSLGVTANQTEFSNDNTSLTPGQIYYYQAWANNSAGFSTGSELTFLTKPNAPTGFTATTTDSTKIALSWSKGIGANNTIIERNTSSSWNLGQGTEIYNNTGTSTTDTGLSEGTKYYYQAWSYTNWTHQSITLQQWSDENKKTSNITDNIITVTNILPENNSQNKELNPTLTIKVNHSLNYSMNITWKWGTDSSCSNLIGSYSSVHNGTYSQADTNNNFSSYDQTYYWKIIINDTHGIWSNHTYDFTTKSNPSPGTGPSSQQTEEEEEQNDTTDDTNNDTIGPSITIITPEDKSKTFDKTPEIKAGVSDESGINTSSIILRIDGNTVAPIFSSGYIYYTPKSNLSVGTHNIYLKLSDIIGNSNSKSWSFEVKKSIYHEKQNLSNSTKENITIISPTNKTKTIIDKIEISTNKNYPNLEIEITEIGKNITDVIDMPDPGKIEHIPPDINLTYILYRYLDFAIKSNDTYIIENIGEVKINFTVNSSWLNGYGIYNKNISMLRYHNNSWIKLNTSFKREISENKLLFQCNTTGFSTFAVVGSKVVKKDEPLGSDEPGIPWIIIIGFIISAIVILIIVLFRAGYIYIEEKE